MYSTTKEVRLTRTEIRVLDLVLTGLTSREIAGLMHRSVRTVEVHRQHVMTKLGVHNLVQLVQVAGARGAAPQAGPFAVPAQGQFVGMGNVNTWVPD